MHSNPLKKQLENALLELPNELSNKGVSGHCDAFAVALMDYLLAHGVATDDLSLVVIGRKRVDIDSLDVVETNPLSHVVVEAFGTSWDVLGPEASERWEDDWIQPDAEDGRDEFLFSAFTRDKLVALRRQRDRRGIDPDMVAAYRLWMDRTVAPEAEQDVSAEPKHGLKHRTSGRGPGRGRRR